MNSQLIAAENLSESLSKQMAALSAKFPSEDQKNVKTLFETIGIPYEPSFGASDMKNVINTPSSKKLVLSDLVTNKDWSKKNQATAFKVCEPEMSRRRRDSLDQVLFSQIYILSSLCNVPIQKFFLVHGSNISCFHFCWKNSNRMSMIFRTSI